MIFNYNNFIFDLLNKVPSKKGVHVGETPQKGAINIYVNIEHKLVKRTYIDGSDVEFVEDETYLIPMSDYSSFLNSDIVIDYSIPNIIHMNKSKRTEIHDKQVYIPPIIFEFNPFTKTRTIDVLTTFYQPGIYRRDMLLDNIRNNNFNHVNISNCFLPNETIQLLKNTKILINIHQKDHCQTFEELRCLPAVLCGTIVIAEESPYKEHIPYNKFIIWSSYDKIIETVKNVLSDYSNYYEAIFINSDIEKVIHEMKVNSINELEKRIAICDN